MASINVGKGQVDNTSTFIFLFDTLTYFSFIFPFLFQILFSIKWWGFEQRNIGIILISVIVSAHLLPPNVKHQILLSSSQVNLHLSLANLLNIACITLIIHAKAHCIHIFNPLDFEKWIYWIHFEESIYYSKSSPVRNITCLIALTNQSHSITHPTLTLEPKPHY